jgi:hypothetical protein
MNQSRFREAMTTMKLRVLALVLFALVGTGCHYHVETNGQIFACDGGADHLGDTGQGEACVDIKLLGY